MSSKRDSAIDVDQVVSFLKDAVVRVKNEEDPEVLNELRKIYRKNVPLTLRLYVAAYLVKQSRGSVMRGSTRRGREETRRDRSERPSRSDNRRNDRPARPDVKESRAASRSRVAERSEEHTADRTAEVHEHQPRVQIDPSLATTVFVGIGRNRRVYPRDLVGLLVSVTGLDRERIGDIRVLANYSFIQLFSEDADKVINALNGYDYRGRKLSVSYSRQKEDAADSTKPETASDDFDRVPNVSNVTTSSPVVESSSSMEASTMAQQAAFAAAQRDIEPTAEEIAAARAPRSSSSDVAEAAPESVQENL